LAPRSNVRYHMAAPRLPTSFASVTRCVTVICQVSFINVATAGSWRAGRQESECHWQAARRENETGTEKATVERVSEKSARCVGALCRAAARRPARHGGVRGRGRRLERWRRRKKWRAIGNMQHGARRT